MKVLILDCVDCHKTKRICAVTVDALLAKIDASEWVDLPNDPGAHQRLHQAARCPACYVAHWSSFPEEA